MSLVINFLMKNKQLLNNFTFNPEQLMIMSQSSLLQPLETMIQKQAMIQDSLLRKINMILIFYLGTMHMTCKLIRENLGINILTQCKKLSQRLLLFLYLEIMNGQTILTSLTPDFGFHSPKLPEITTVTISLSKIVSL